MSKIKARLNDIYKVTPRFAKISALLLIFLSLIYAVCCKSKPFANFINGTVGYAYRAVAAHFTNIFPISLAEMILILSPLIIGAVIFLAVRVTRKKYGGYRFICNLIGVILFIISALIVSLSCGYRTDTLDARIGVADREVSSQDLYETAEWLINEANALSEHIEFDESGASVMPFSFKQLSHKLNLAYESIYEEYSFIRPLHSNIKPVIFSDAMAYTHITGVYSFFTGEANVNVAFPDYSVVFTAAHELAHQRGISRENEANFVAFLVCSASDDPYIRYCAYTNMYEYVVNALGSASPEKYYEVSELVCDRILGEFYAYSRFFDKYRYSKASDVADELNDTYLTIQGTEGVRSYGLVVDLAVSYYYSKVFVAE